MKIILLEKTVLAHGKIASLFKKMKKGAYELGIRTYKDFSKEPDLDGVGLIILNFVDGKQEFTMLKKLTREHQKIPTLMIVEKQDTSRELAARKMGVSDYLVLGMLTPPLLHHSIQFAVESRATEASLIDSQQMYKALADHAPIGIWNVTTDGYTVYVNDVMCEMLEIESPEELQNETFHSFFTIGSLERINEESKKREMGIISSYEVTLVGRNGSKREVVVSGGPVFNSEGKQTGQIGAFTDITERKKAELQLWAAKENAEQATKLRDKFVSLVAHDLRAPLSTLLSYLRMVGENRNEAETEKFLANSISITKNMLELTENLLNINRIKTGILRPEMRFFNLYQMVLKINFTISDPAAMKGISLKIDIPHGARIFGDPALLQQVIENLLVNSIKFCKRGDTIKIFLEPGRSGMQVIAVSDTGIGIEENRRKNLFNYEEKTSTAGTAGETGTGLGLPLCKDITKAHSGDLEVESVLGQGSVFRIVIPDRKPFAIIISKNAESRKFIADILAVEEVDVIEMDDCSRAFGTVKERRPDLVFVDYPVATESGYVFLEQAKKNHEFRDVLILILAEQGEDEIGETTLSGLSTDIVRRPFTEQAIISKIKLALG